MVCHALSSLCMAVLDEDFGADLTLVEGDGGVRSSPRCRAGAPARATGRCRMSRRPPARSGNGCGRIAAEARAEELRWAEVAARSDAGSWKSRFRSCRRRLSEANEDLGEGTPPRGKGRAFLAGGSGAPGDAPLRSRQRVERDRRDRVARARKSPGCARPWRSREAVEDPAGWRSGEAGCDPASREAGAGPEGHDQLGAARGDHPAQLGGGPAEQADRPAGQAAGGGGVRGRRASGRPARSCPASPYGLYRELRILRDCEARGSRRRCPSDGLPAAPCPGSVRGREGQAEGPACEAALDRGDAVRSCRSTRRISCATS